MTDTITATPIEVEVEVHGWIDVFARWDGGSYADLYFGNLESHMDVPFETIVIEDILFDPETLEREVLDWAEDVSIREFGDYADLVRGYQ